MNEYNNEIRLHIPGAIRSKKNSKQVFSPRPGKKIVIPSKAYDKWQKEAREWVAYSIDRQVFPIAAPCHVSAVIYFKGNQPDLSGAMESVGDCFQGLLWANDGQIESWDGTKLIKDNEFPRIEMVLKWKT